jgi:hypothetical protein
MAIKRLYVPRRRYDEIVSGVEAILSRSVVGSGLEDGVTMGPLNTRRQRAYVVELLDEARASGTDVMQLGEFATPCWSAVQHAWGFPEVELHGRGDVVDDIVGSRRSDGLEAQDIAAQR